MKIQQGILSLLFLFIGLLPLSLMAQEDYDSKSIRDHTFKINFLLPGIEYEAKFLEDFTVSIRGGLKLKTRFFPDIPSSEVAVVSPFGEIQIRRFYRTKSVSNKGKKLIANSGDYFGLRGMYSYINDYSTILPGGDPRVTYALLAGPMYGLQRTYQNKLTWSFHVGIGGYLSGVRLSAAPFLGISIGFLAFDKHIH